MRQLGRLDRVSSWHGYKLSTGIFYHFGRRDVLCYRQKKHLYSKQYCFLGYGVVSCGKQVSDGGSVCPNRWSAVVHGVTSRKTVILIFAVKTSNLFMLLTASRVTHMSAALCV
jgi:hypothetical protein